jgi:hypothetical protein
MPTINKRIAKTRRLGIQQHWMLRLPPILAGFVSLQSSPKTEKSEK